MGKRQLQQIKTFWVEVYNDKTELDKDINKYVVELFNRTGNYPKIKSNSKYVSVISNVLVDVERD